MKALWLCCLLIPGVALADIVGATSRNMNFEFKLGPFKPLIDRESTLTGTPYETTFGGGPLLLGEFGLERQFFQKVGTLGAGVSIGYGEKFGHAVNSVTGEITEESTGLHLIPMKVLLAYRFDYLAQLHRHPEGLRMNALSRYLMVTGGNITGLTDELEKEGLVSRQASPGDRRAFVLQLTAAGRESFERMAAEHERWVVELLGGLKAADRRTLHALLGTLRMTIAERQGAGPAGPAA